MAGGTGDKGLSMLGMFPTCACEVPTGDDRPGISGTSSRSGGVDRGDTWPLKVLGLLYWWCGERGEGLLDLGSIGVCDLREEMDGELVRPDGEVCPLL